MVACQIGTAFAARTERASLRSVGVFSNRLLLWGIAFELALAALLIYVPLFQDLLGTAALPATDLLIVAALPVHRLGRRRAAPLAPAPVSRCAIGAGRDPWVSRTRDPDWSQSVAQIRSARTNRGSACSPPR